MSWFYLALLVTASLGGGAFILLATSTLSHFRFTERLAISFGLGSGLIGWCVFFLIVMGHTSSAVLATLLVILASGIVFLKPKNTPLDIVGTPNAYGIILIIGLSLVLCFDFIEGITPPADADSLAYHFALPKAFLNAGQLYPVFQAAEGSVPLLQQMIYLAALGTGGELTLTLWTMVSGWGAPALMFVVLRRFIGVNWALAITIAYLCTPAVTYGGGSGHVEARNAMFVIISVLAVAEARASNQFRFIILAGLAAGFFVASKYTGLIFAFSVGLTLLFQKRWFAHGIIFGLAVVFAGGQWYGWNAFTTGDPLFPMLYGIVDYLPGTPWNQNIHSVYKAMIDENVIPSNLLWLIIYPIKATLFPHPDFESLRVGFGPLALLLLPFATVGIWSFRDRLIKHPLFVFGTVCLLSYCIWFLLGPSQRVRHLLPIYPLLLICFSVCAIKVAKQTPNLLRPLHAIFALVIPLQLFGATLFAVNYGRYIFENKDRHTFLRENIPLYDAAFEANKFLTSSDKLLVSDRQLIYLFEIPIFYANPPTQARVSIHQHATDPRRFWSQLNELKISHILVNFDPESETNPGSYSSMLIYLQEKQCLKVVIRFNTKTFTSRTLPALGQSQNKQGTLRKLTPNTCIYQD